jgi:hypothetical protein
LKLNWLAIATGAPVKLDLLEVEADFAAGGSRTSLKIRCLASAAMFQQGPGE